MVNIRLAKKEDLNRLAEVYVEVYQVFDVGEHWTPESALKLLRYWFSRQPDLSFVAEDDNKLVGAFFVGVKPWWDGNHLTDGEIFVNLDYQSHGIGSKLLQIVFQTALDKYKVTVWDTVTFTRYDFPLNWYRKLGFEKIEGWELISGDIKKALEILKRRKQKE